MAKALRDKPKALTAHDVFTPSSFPEHSYVARGDADLEDKLRFALKTKGQIVSLSGPSKSGKTVLVEKVVGKENLVPVVGAGIRDPDMIWTRVLDWLAMPTEESMNKRTQVRTSTRGVLKVTGDIVVAGATTEGSLQAGGLQGTDTRETTLRRGLEQVIEEVGGTEHVILVDDFHYMDRAVQAEVAKQLKEAARRDLKIVTAAVPHRRDDVVRANPELRGRVAAVDVGYWQTEDLVRIAESGFAALNVTIDEASAVALAKESAGSPQLMQALCLYACFVLGTETRLEKLERRTLTTRDHVKACRLTSTITDFRALVDLLDPGVRARAERKIYAFRDGSKGDVYRALLKAIAADPMQLAFGYEELLERLKRTCDGEAPAGSSVVGACVQLAKVAAEHLPAARVLEWDEQKEVLDIPDPYLLFYLRWSDRLTEPSYG